MHNFDLNSVLLSFETWVILTIIVTLTKQLQETEEVTGELIIWHYFLIWKKMKWRKVLNYILKSEWDQAEYSG